MSVNNSGNVIVSGDRHEDATELANIHSGIYAGFYDEDKSDTDEFGNTGNVSVVHTGRIEVKNGIGIDTEVYGSGNSKVEVKDGATIEAGKAADTPNNIDASWGMGIYSRAEVDSTNDDVDDDVDVLIIVAGGSEITAYSADQDDTLTTDYDESYGIGIFADAGSDANGRIVTHINRSTITADTAMKFVDGRTLLEMEYSTVTGDIQFDGDGDTAVATSDINLIEIKGC